MDFVARKNEENLKLSWEINNYEPNSDIVNEDDRLESKNEQCITKISQVQDFYKKKNIFITGGTGFLGKILIEKILRTCDVENIYLLVRPKKGKDVHTRIEEIFDDIIFNKLREVAPKFRHKIVAIDGDCSVAGLGLSLDDRQMLISNCHIVFHAAATVRFDEKLKLAVSINVHGTRDILNLCNQMRNLKVIMHISTAYSNCHLKAIDEKFYKYHLNYNDMDKIIGKMSDAALDDITPKILGKWPNTYAFTKAMAEDMVRVNSRTLPIGMFRPAIVTSTVKDPVVGWIDNLYGPTGVVAGVGTGVLRTMHCNRTITANIVPVDMTVNALIASAWDTAEQYRESKINRESDVDNIPIYNYVSSVENPLTWGQFTELNVQNGFDFPFSSAIWYICFFMHKSATMNKIYMFFLHFIPALLMDTILLCIGQKPKLLKAYKKIHKFSNVISYFCTNEWDFTNNNVQLLWKKMDAEDRKNFDFDMKQLNWEEYLRYYIRGMRVYLFKDDLSTLDAAKRKWNRLFWCHQILKVVLASAILYTFWSVLCPYF